MFSKSYETLVAEVDNLQAYLNTTHTLRAALVQVQPSSEPSLLDDLLMKAMSDAPDATRWRVLEHTLIVSRLYAIYESFCEQSFRDWIFFLSVRLRFDKLPQKIIESYPSGFANIIGMLPSQRYPLLVSSDLIANYNGALKGRRSYSLDAECLIHHKNNLRWTELNELLHKCALGDFGTWLGSSRGIAVQAADGRVVEHVSKRLEIFVQYRNDASHGLISPDEILGFDELMDQLAFITSFANSIDQFIKSKMIEVLQKTRKAICLGSVTEVFARANAFVCIVSRARVEVGQRIFIIKNGQFIDAAVNSLQVDGQSVESVTARKRTEIGMQIDGLPVKGSKLFAFT